MYSQLPYIYIDLPNNIRTFLNYTTYDNLYKQNDIIVFYIDRIISSIELLNNKGNQVKVCMPDFIRNALAKSLKKYNQTCDTFLFGKDTYTKSGQTSLQQIQQYFEYSELIQNDIFGDCFTKHIRSLNNQNVRKKVVYCVMRNHEKNLQIDKILNKCFPGVQLNKICNHIDFDQMNLVDPNVFLHIASSYKDTYDFIVLDIEYALNDFKTGMTYDNSQNNVSMPQFSNEEHLLLYLCFILNILRRKGSCILKIPCPLLSSLQSEICAICSSVFEHVILNTPLCHDVANNTYYLLCYGYKRNHIEHRIFDLTHSIYNNIIFKPNGKYINSLLRVNIPLYYQTRLNEVFVCFLYKYLDTLTLHYNMNTSTSLQRVESFNRKNVMKANQWLNNYIFNQREEREKHINFTSHTNNDYNEDNMVIHKRGKDVCATENDRSEIRTILDEVINIVDVCSHVT